MGVFGCVNGFLMCQCVRMPKRCLGQDVWIMCVMLRFAGVCRPIKKKEKKNFLGNKINLESFSCRYLSS